MLKCFAEIGYDAKLVRCTISQSKTCVPLPAKRIQIIRWFAGKICAVLHRAGRHGTSKAGQKIHLSLARSPRVHQMRNATWQQIFFDVWKDRAMKIWPPPLPPSWMAKHHICEVLAQGVHKEHFPLSRGWNLTKHQDFVKHSKYLKLLRIDFSKCYTLLCYTFLTSESCFLSLPGVALAESAKEAGNALLKERTEISVHNSKRNEKRKQETKSIKEV